MITYLLNTLVDSIKTSLINKLGLDPSTEVDLDDFPQLIDDIPILDSVEELTVTENGTYTGTDGVTYNPVNVNLPLGSKSVTANGTYTASDDSLQGYSSVTVDIDDTDLYRDTTDSTYESVKTLSNCGAFPMLSLTAEINAVQDLHGYDKPWAGGANYNQWDEEWEVGAIGYADGQNITTTDRIRSKNYIPILPSTSYYYIFPNGGAYFFYDENKTFISAAQTTSSKEVTSPSNAYFTRIAEYPDYGTTYNNDIAINYPSSIITYSPYSNICPISGWDSIDVYQCEDNLFDKTTISGNKIIDISTGEEMASYGRFSSDYIKVNPSTDYYASNVIKSAQWYCAFYYDKYKNYLSCGELSSSGDTASGVITTPSNCSYVRLVGITTYIDTVQLTVGTTATPYEAYNSQPHTTALSTTCYGGSKDIKGNERINRKITIPNGTGTYAEKMSVRKSGSTERNSYYFILDSAVTPNTTEVMCNMFDFIGNISSVSDSNAGECFYTESNQQFRFTLPMDSELQTADQVNAWLAELYNNGTPLQIVEVLATPTTATSDAIDLTLAEGVNNIWASSGNVGDARYFRKVEL